MSLTIATTALAALRWDPEIRNIVAFAVGVLVLCGAVYLLLLTNLGARLGLLIAVAVFLGWMTIMGAIWWMYGIGMQGEAPVWEVQEVNEGDIRHANLAEARTLPLPNELPDPERVLERRPDLDKLFNPPPEDEEAADEPAPKKQPTLGDIVELDPALRSKLQLEEGELGGWDLLMASDPQRGDAAAAADTALGPDGEKLFNTSSEYKIVDAYSYGGKEPVPEEADLITRAKHRLLSVWHLRHPPHYAIVQVKAALAQPTKPGEAPPPPRTDPSAPLISVVLVRDLGDLRFPAAVITVVSAILFALSCWRLHARDQLVASRRAIAPT